jgi:Zn-dependent peptidase ImmA (M78 family)/transcriptional regulator with XRE-family HTH domain
VNSVSHVNADCLKVGRQARGLSQTQLATASGITQGAISKFENGLIEPGADALGKIAQALRFPVSFFYEQDRIFGLPVSMQYRKRASVGPRSIEQLEAEINLRIMHLRRLLSSVDYVPELPFPKLDIDEFGGNAEAVADMVRRIWQIPTGPIRNLIQVVERAGCVVFPCNFQSIGVDGLTLQPRGLPTCIFLNSAMPGDRQRFTLAHELGHAIMHQVPSAEMEHEADSFAAALLMPARDVGPQLSGGVTLPRLAALKPIWRVSMAALLVRAKTLGMLTDSQASYLWRQFSKAGYRTREPSEIAIPAEVPQVLSDILRSHLNDLGYSLGELASALHVFEEDLLVMHNIEQAPKKPELRVVK